MKHILSTLAIAFLGAVATPVFAGIIADYEAFTIETSPYANEYNQGVGAGCYYTIKMKSAGSLFITNYFTDVGDGLSGQGGLLTNDSYGITHYGFIDPKGEIHDFAIGDATRIEQFDGYSYTQYLPNPDYNDGRTMPVTTTIPRDGYCLGNFAAKAEIQVYLARKDAEGKVVEWTATGKPQSSEYTSRFGANVDKADNNLPIGQLYFPGEGEPQINFGIIASTVKSQYGDPINPFSGSPLPGGLQIALVSGLFALGFWYVRRRKAIAA